MDKEDTKSLEHYKKQKNKAERNGNLKSQAEACSIIGEIYSRYERFDEAIEEHQQELLLSEAQNCCISIALANRKLGECYCKKQLFDKAIPLHKRYLSLARECDDKVEEQRALATIGATYLGQCELENTYRGKREAYKLAEESFIKGLEVTESIQSTLKEVDYMDMKGRLYQNLGLLYDEMNQLEASSQYFQKALAINKKYNLLENLFLCQSSLVTVCQKHGKFDEAKRHVELCVETAQKMKARDNEAVALMLKALILLQEKDFQMSRHLLKKAHKVGIPSQQERYETCYKYVKVLHKGTETINELPEEDFNKRIKLFDRMGDAAADLGLYKQAVHYYQQLLQASIELKREKTALATIHVSLAETYRDDKQLDKAIQHYRHEIECRSEQEQDQVCRSWLNIGGIQELNSDDYSLSQESYVNAFNAAKQAKNRKLQVESLECLVALFKCHKNSKLLQKTQERLNHTLSKYQITDSESTEDSQEDEIIDDEDVSDMSDLTESEDEEIPSNAASVTTIKSGRSTRKKVIKRNIKGETPLHTACIDGKLKEVLKYISQGHPVNVRDHGGWTPLHEASNFGHLEIVTVLIEHGANVDDRGGTECKGLTPLMDAASNGMLDVVKVLIDSGASVNAKDDKLMTALDHLTDYVEASKHELSSTEMAEYQSMMDIMRDKMPFHRAPAKVSKSQRGGLIPESEAQIFSKTVEKKQRSRNDVIYNALSDSEGDELEDNVRYSSKKNPRKRSPSPLYNTESQLSDDELFTPHVLEDLDQEHGGQLAYRNAMASIGSASQRTSQVVKNSPKLSTNKSALVAEEEYLNDDWLIDDMKPSAKRRKISTDGFSLTSGLKTNKQYEKTVSSYAQVNNRTPNRRKDLEHIHKAPISDSDPENSDADSMITDANDNCRSSSTADNNMGFSPERCLTPSPGFRALPDLEDTNSNESIPSVMKIDLTDDGWNKVKSKKKINRQTKLTDFGASVSKCVPLSQPKGEEINASSQVAGVMSNTSEPSNGNVLKIKVQIGEKLLMVPIVDRDGTKTCAWLIGEVAHRYLRIFGLKPLLTLGTRDGAHFSPDDHVSQVLSDGDKIEGFLQGWDLPPMTEQYKTSCKSLKTVMYKNIERLMRSCELGTGRLDLANICLRLTRFNPVVKAIQYQSCLRELELKGNCLGDAGVESLCSAFDTIPNLTYLGLACNNITKEGLKHISSTVMKEKETSLKWLSCLDVSFNPLCDESQHQLISVIKALPGLNKLCIASCNLTAQFFHSDRPMIAQALNDSNIQHIDISYNLLENIGVYFFLRCQNPTKIQSLNLSSTISTNPCRLCEHLSEYVSGDGCALQNIELCRLNIDEGASEELKRFTESATQLTSIDLSSNFSLTCEVMKKAIEGACHSTSQLERVIVNNCGIKSLSLELYDSVVEKLTMPCPLRELQFTCDELTRVDFESVKQIWTEKWSENGKVDITEKSVKLSVV